MLKEIILCDYYKREYELPEPQVVDYLGVFGDKTKALTPTKVMELGLANDKNRPKIKFKQRKRKAVRSIY